MTLLKWLTPLNPCQTQHVMPCFIVKHMTILLLIGIVFVIFWEMFFGVKSLNSVLLLVVVNFESGFRLELM